MSRRLNDENWWTNLSDDERDAVLAFVNQGDSEDFSYLDDGQEGEGEADMCPHCGESVRITGSLTATHDWPKPFRVICPGSGQHPRCAKSDARPLWNGEPNLRFAGRSAQQGESE